MSQPNHPVIAIDGTAASGKSTFARSLVQSLGYVYVNTGAMYRGVTWYLQQREIDLGDLITVSREIEGAAIESRLENGELVFQIDGLNPLPHVREDKINAGVSLAAQVPAVRKLLVAQQQDLARLAPVVMEGRDIGTVVFPQTPYKFFLDADADIRAQRRTQQGEKDVIEKRDKLDQQRQHSPLTCAPDALRLDSGRHTVEELVAMALQHLASQGMKY